MPADSTNPIRLHAMAMELARQALQDNHAAFSQMEHNLSAGFACQNMGVALAARGAVFECLAATAVLGQFASFESGANTAIQWGCKIAEAFRPAPELLLVELCLAIRFKNHYASQQLARSILGTAGSDEFYNLERGQSLALAALVDLDYGAARQYALRLHHASASGEFDKDNSLLAAAWAEVFRKLAQQDIQGCVDSLLLANKQFVRQVDQNLKCLARGVDSDITVFDMLDWAKMAIEQLVDSLKLNR